MPLQLTLRTPLTLPVDLTGFTPCRHRDRSVSELARTRVLVGNRSHEIGELFAISGSPQDLLWRWQGDLRHAHRLGQDLRDGCIHVEGSIGRHTGADMQGGRIEIEGDVGDWLGAEMVGGQILVRGHAGDLVGAAYRGAPQGMTGGSIVVLGNAGHEVGRAMRRGVIAIGGNVGKLAGFDLRAGTIAVRGTWGERAGAGMRRGTLLALHPHSFPLLPTFRFACEFRPPMLVPLLRSLHRLGFHPYQAEPGPTFRLYSGDLLEGGRGEVLIPTS